MARLCAAADGDNTSASTWKLINSTSFNESETTFINSTTSYSTSYTQFTPGAITIDGLAIRVAQRLGTTGTLSVDLYNHTAAAQVAGSEVTVNMTDVIDCNGNLEGGWMFFKFASNITLIAANAYSVRVKTSTSGTLGFYGSSSTALSRFVRTTTTQAPVAGDDRFVMGEWTGAGAITTRTVTLDDTSTVDYGSASTSVITPALSISNGGIVLAGSAATRTYIQKISGNVVVYHSGILRIATSASRMPTSSSFTWTFDCVSNVDFGIDVKRKGEFTAYGAAKNRWAYLTADEASTSTVIQLDDTSGWVNGDTLLFAPTINTITQAETKIISTVDSSTQVTLTAGLTNAHTGTGDVIGEVGNLTSNVKIIGISSTVGTFITFRDSSLGVLDNVEVQYFGSGTGNKRGIDGQHNNTGVNSLTLESCSFRDHSNTSGFVGSNVSTSGAFLYMDSNVIYCPTNLTNGVIIGGSGVSGIGDYSFTYNLIVGSGSGTGVSHQGASFSTTLFEYNRFAGFTTALTCNLSNLSIETETNLNNCFFHSNTVGISNSSIVRKIFTDCTFAKNVLGINTLTGRIIVENCNFFGNATGGIAGAAGGSSQSTFTVVNNSTFRGSSTTNSQNGIGFAAGFGSGDITFNDCSFGSGTAHTVADVAISNFINGKIIFNNCSLTSSVELTTTAHTNIAEDGYIGFIDIDGTPGNNKMVIRQGVTTPDTVRFRTASPSLKIEPKSSTIPATTKLFTFKVPINSGQTCTPGVYVRESVVGDGTDYNGNRIKLYMKANYNLGFTSDTLLATATSSSEGAWELLASTTSAMPNDGVLEFYITCDGTTGWVNIDDFSYVNA